MIWWAKTKSGRGLLALAASVLLSISLVSIALAWSGNKIFSPNSGESYIWRDGQIIGTWSDAMVWSPDRVDALRWWAQQYPQHFATIDHTDMGRHLGCYSPSGNPPGDCQFWTNLPGPVFDADDDDGDGRWEETEVTVGDPFSLVPWAPYYYIADFWDYDGWSSGRVEVNSQLSQWWGWGEMESVDFEWLADLYY